jgi:hypothetical protein
MQVQRLRDAYLDRGQPACLLAAAGKLSNRAHKGAFRDQVLDIVRGRYAGFGSTLAHEKLLEQHRFGPVARDARRLDRPAGVTHIQRFGPTRASRISVSRSNTRTVLPFSQNGTRRALGTLPATSQRRTIEGRLASRHALPRGQ